MSAASSDRPPFRQDRRRRPRRRAAVLRCGVRLILAAAVFGAGVALGQALHDNPKPGPMQTLVRTLKPLPLPPAARTVTVTLTR